MPTLDHENTLRAAGFRVVAGIDEAGRGPLAGPVCVAAVVLPDDFSHPVLNDSKQLSEVKRERLYEEITADARIRWHCVTVEPAEIDRINILQATMLAMQRAVQGLRLKPVKVLVDGNRLPRLDIVAEAIVKGDAKVPAISAASILAKVHRDRLCLHLHERWPQYGFDNHKGYGTAEHIQALREHGACDAHRRTFAPVSGVLR